VEALTGTLFTGAALAGAALAGAGTLLVGAALLEYLYKSQMTRITINIRNRTHTLDEFCGGGSVSITL